MTNNGLQFFLLFVQTRLVSGTTQNVVIFVPNKLSQNRYHLNKMYVKKKNSFCFSSGWNDNFTIGSLASLVRDAIRATLSWLLALEISSFNFRIQTGT